jgi:hypothetical protein
VQRFWVGILSGILIGAALVGAVWFFSSHSGGSSSPERTRVIAYVKGVLGPVNTRSVESLGNGLWRVRSQDETCVLVDVKLFESGIPSLSAC